MCSFLYISLVDSVLDSYGIEGKALLSYIGDADSVQHLEELPVVKNEQLTVVTNELILNLVKTAFLGLTNTDGWEEAKYKYISVFCKRT